MKNKSSILTVLAVVLAASAGPVMAADDGKGKELSGRDIAFDNKKGNCLSCHAVPNDPKAVAAGNIAPPFIMMKERYPDRAKLRAQIWDSTQANPKTAMPPFGKHRILSEQEIDLVVDFVQSL
ncbi:cytochrome CBB3 [Sulfuricella sp. T08]|uniref:sulfur oxidation c-type cytochrome SoxX n=1 Tax=Sulfuricella sp. T08 TaxID=1632857 RepID=UPI00061799DF|nr:cytochrome CBB3 [Sulfuricella sp. T08]